MGNGGLAGFWVSDAFIENNRAQSINLSELEEFDRTLAAMLEEFPEMRRKLHQELGALAKREIEVAIASSGINDSHGKIRRWQVMHVGSGGGYAAVRPLYENDGKYPRQGENSPGAITRYLNQGHRIRRFNKVSTGKHRKKGRGYRPRIHVSYVNGYHFYDTAINSFEAKAIKKAEEFANRLVERLEGGR